MAALPASVARVRGAVRAMLRELPEPVTVLVACSGGPDSMALAAAVRFVAPRLGRRAGLVTVDHGLQDGSGRRAAALADWAGRAGFDPVESVPVTVDVRSGGPEGAAREARYAALAAAADRYHAAVMLGHTRDDQAETVLLALARGSGPRGLAGMPARREHLWRPLLAVDRADTVAACRELDLPVWHDPHNDDPAYTRSRLRAAMPVLTRTLGDRLVANLARTAELVAADSAALDDWAGERLRVGRAADPARLDIARFVDLPRAVRTRVWRQWLLANGAEPDGLSYVHIMAVDALVVSWRGQGPVAVPGGGRVCRDGTDLVMTRR